MSNEKYHLGPWKQVQSAVKAIHNTNELLMKDPATSPIAIVYNDRASVVDLPSIAQMKAGGSTDFVKGSLCAAPAAH